MGQTQLITIDDLLTMSSLSPKNFDSYAEKKGFTVKRRSICDNQMGFSFFGSRSALGPDSLPVTRSIDYYKKGDTWYITLHTTSLDEYLAGRNKLKRIGFFSGTKDSCQATPLLFQRKTIALQSSLVKEEDAEPVYSFILTKKELPALSEVSYAEDLLKFDSHEYLVSFFGEDNVKKDFYSFSEEESKKCSILFPNSPQQAVFIWDDENNFRKLSLVLISGTLSTASSGASAQYAGSFRQNTWTSKNGVYSGMRINDLLKLNANDFQFYGSKSELSLMVEPKVTGNINFKHVGVMFNCFNCSGSVMMDKQKISASEAINNSLALHVSYILISP
jgi:hypothetical protein